MRICGSLKVFFMLILGGMLLWPLASTAMAGVTGPCTGTLNGADADSFSTSGTALEVPYDGTVTVGYTSSGNITGHKVDMEFAGFPWTVDEGDDDGDSWSSSVAVADYSKYGVGIYKVISYTYGDSNCTGTAFVKVTGKNPLTTAAGAAGAAATGIGVIGTAATTVSSARKPRKPDLIDGIMDDLTTADRNADDRFTDDEMGEMAIEAVLGCWTVVIPALVQSVAFMLVGAGGVGAPAIRYRPYVSLAALFSSLLAGLGTLVLAQQYALVYPSLTVIIIWLAVALALGVALPSLGRLMGVRKANAIIAERVAQLSAGASPAAPVTQPVAETPVADESRGPREETGGKSFCHNCGGELNAGDEFCGDCGTKKAT